MDNKINSKDLLSDIIIYGKYAKHIDDLNRRETWAEIVMRNMNMHIKKFPHLESEIMDAYTHVFDKNAFSSMRSFQFSGLPIELSPNRIFNCSAVACDDIACFSETMFLLLGGSGVGISVQKHHVEQLPEISGPKKRKRRFLVGDSIEGWADAIKILMESYFTNKSFVEFDFRDIRAKGERLITSGGKAPGPQPLKDCIHNIRKVLDNAILERGIGTEIKSIEVHDIMCYIATAVLSGGIRRAALISLFSFDDIDMLSCKSGSWWEMNPQRALANNSVVLVRHKIKDDDFKYIWDRVQASGCGEPGIYFTNDKNMLCNPCCLAGDSKLLTSNGYIDIKDLAGKKNLKLKNKFGDVVDGKVWRTGKKEVFEIKAGNKRNPYILKSTGDHIFSDINDNEIEAINLKGKRLAPYYEHKTIDKNSLPLRYGFILGDGCFRASSDQFLNVECCFTPTKDGEVQSLFSKTGKSNDPSRYTIDVTYKELESYGIDTSAKTYERELPKNVDDDFLTGLYSANGSIINNGRISYKTTSPKLRDQLISVLESRNISCYYTTNEAKEIEWSNGKYISKESYDINISEFKSILIFANRVGFIQTYKRNALSKIIIDKAPYVYSIKSLGYHDVYDFSLFDDTHWGVVNGIITHNCEITMPSNTFCNLTTVNVSDVKTQEELNSRVRSASFIGTLQATYTDFHYLRNIWKKNSEKEALLGVSMTGIGSGSVLNLDLEEAANVAVEENKRAAKLLGIKPAYRVTCIKPEGTSSLVAGSSSGIHAWHSPYYIRRIRMNKDEALFKYLINIIPELIEDEYFKPEIQSVLSIPVSAPEGAIFRDEDVFDLLNRVKRFHKEWILPGHINGINTNNVSVTVSVKDNEWDSVGEWMWSNRNSYNGISVLPYDGGTYTQPPFEECDEEKYNELLQYCKNIDLTQVKEILDTTDHSGESACSGNGCQVNSI